MLQCWSSLWDFFLYSFIGLKPNVIFSVHWVKTQSYYSGRHFHWVKTQSYYAGRPSGTFFLYSFIGLKPNVIMLVVPLGLISLFIHWVKTQSYYAGRPSGTFFLLFYTFTKFSLKADAFFKKSCAFFKYSVEKSCEGSFLLIDKTISVKVPVWSNSFVAT
jgi:hypothetical protein